MIAPEGKWICGLSFLISFFLLGLFYFSETNIILNVFLIVSIIETFFCLYFFRDPKRDVVSSDKKIISPADGKVVRIINTSDDQIGEVCIVSIFLSVFNVHRQWVPINSKVLDCQYNKGTFLGAFFDKASDKNEQHITYFETHFGNYKVKQIAGFIARRIINYMSPLQKVSSGDNLGFIRFGSRVDVILPESCTINVSVGDKVSGCRTILGEFNE